MCKFRSLHFWPVYEARSGRGATHPLPSQVCRFALASSSFAFVEIQTVRGLLRTSFPRSWDVESEHCNPQMTSKLFKEKLLEHTVILFYIKAGVNVKAVFTSLNTAFLPISRSRFKRRQIPSLITLSTIWQFCVNFWEIFRCFGKERYFLKG